MGEIPLTQGQVAFVDDEDFEVLNQWKWYAMKNGCTFYAVRQVRMLNGKQKMSFMHHYIIGQSITDMHIDHIDGSGLNNQKTNIRIVSQRENKCNRHDGMTSEYPGVFWHQRGKKWCAQITVDGKREHIGLFDSELDAAAMYRIARVIHGLR